MQLWFSISQLALALLSLILPPSSASLPHRIQAQGRRPRVQVPGADGLRLDRPLSRPLFRPCDWTVSVQTLNLTCRCPGPTAYDWTGLVDARPGAAPLR